MMEMLSKWREQPKLCTRSAGVREYVEHRSTQIGLLSPLNQRFLTLMHAFAG
jgi:hypothetical protein